MNKTRSASEIVSLRLTQEERRLVDQAAAKMGWKAAHFLRASAIERAAHVLNLSRPTSFDFSATARRCAEAMVASRTVKVVDADPDLPQEFGHFGEGAIQFPQNELVTLSTVRLVDFRPAPLTQQELTDLQKAVHLGGTEFVSQLLVECRRLVGSVADSKLPAPIDPGNLANAVGNEP